MSERWRSKAWLGRDDAWIVLLHVGQTHYPEGSVGEGRPIDVDEAARWATCAVLDVAVIGEALEHAEWLAERAARGDPLPDVLVERHWRAAQAVAVLREAGERLAILNAP